MDFRGTTALVTGASRGLGRAIVVELLARGAETVYAAVRSGAAVHQYAEHAPRVKCLVFDVRDPEGIAVEATQAAPLDVLIHCAGVCQRSEAFSTPLRDLRDELDVNYLGAIRVVRAFRPAIRDGGCLVAIGSKFIFSTLPGLANYCASKAALWSFIQAVAADPRNASLSVQLVCPGTIDTNMARSLGSQGIAAGEAARAVLDVVGNGQTLVAVLDDSRALVEPLVQHYESHAARLAARSRTLMPGPGTEPRQPG